MSAQFDLTTLVALVDEQVAYALSLRGLDKLYRLARLLGFVLREPMFGAVLKELKGEAAAELKALDREHLDLRVQLRRVLAAYAHQCDLGEQGEQWDLQLAKTVKLRWSSMVVEDPQAHLETLEIVEGIDRCMTDRLAGQEEPDPDWASFHADMWPLVRAYRDHDRRYRQLSLCHAWPALMRLSRASKSHRLRARVDLLSEAAGFEDAFAEALHDWEYGRLSPLEDTVVAFYAQVDLDCRLLQQELRFALGLRRSRLTLVRRYAHRCSAFDGRRLSELSATTKSPEAALTLDFARYLFDAGLVPILDPTISRVRPDVLTLGNAPFYVEAKQYKKGPTKAFVLGFYTQIRSTWARIRAQYPANEAFLVVFRRGGALIEAPERILLDGLPLYTVVCDISNVTASQEKQPVLVISENDIRGTLTAHVESGSTAVRSVRPSAKTAKPRSRVKRFSK